MKKFTLTLFVTLLAGLQIALAQNTRVTGTVKDDNGDPLAGVAVLVGGTQRGVTTNADGTYSIQVPANGALQFSFVGMKSLDVAVDNRKVIDVTMETDAENIDNVIVVAFGTAKKEAFTGSASVISGGDIQRRQTSNVSNALAGQVAGVQMTSNTGQPGAASTIRIRGIGSINASSAPLYVVDGVPFDGDLASINSADIESMTVLKDAASNALYGARGANGVILINTKRGRIGGAVVSFDAKWGVNSRAVPEYKVMKNAGMYYEKYHEALTNFGNEIGEGADFADQTMIYDMMGYGLGLGYQVYSVPDGEQLIVNGKLNPKATAGFYDEETGNYYRADSWNDAAYNQALRQEYNVNVSGATDRMNYYFSAGYLDDNGYVVNSSMQRISSRIKADYQANKWLKIGGNAAFSNNKTKSPDFEQTGSTNMFYLTRNIAPIYPLYVRDENGNIRIDRRGRKIYDYGDLATGGIRRPFMSQSNPISGQELDVEDYMMDQFSGKAFAEVTFLKDFKATVNVGYDVDNTRHRTLANPYYGQMASMGGYASVESRRDAYLNLQQLLTWKKSFGKHHVDALAGHDYYSMTLNNLWGTKNKLYNPTIPEIGNAINSPQTSSGGNEYFTEGFLFRAQYDYDNKYFFSTSYRRDASSRFHPSNRWGNFWSIGGSWLISSEKFMENAKWVNFLKFKASYGSQGNDGLLGNDGLPNYYPYQNQYTLSNNADDYALAISYIGNPNIKWETSYNFNTGIEFGLFDDRLTGGIELFTRKAVDLLFNRAVSPALGYTTYPDNIGDMRNVGVELELTGAPIVRKDFRWTISLNATHYKNKILSLPEENRETGLVVGNFKYVEGGSKYDFYLREYAGVDPENGASLWWQYNEDGSRVTTDNYQKATLRLCGASAIPKLYGGFSTALTYKGIDLNVGFSYQIGGKGYDVAYATLMHTGSSSDLGLNWHQDILNSWTPENPNASVPIVNSENGYYTNARSTRFLIDASYLCLQNITLGYTLPESVSKAMGIGPVRVYAVADNVALFSKRKGFDPRQAVDGIGGQNYAPIRTVSGGLSIQF